MNNKLKWVRLLSEGRIVDTVEVVGGGVVDYTCSSTAMDKFVLLDEDEVPLMEHQSGRELLIKGVSLRVVKDTGFGYLFAVAGGVCYLTLSGDGQWTTAS